MGSSLFDLRALALGLSDFNDLVGFRALEPEPFFGCKALDLGLEGFGFRVQGLGVLDVGVRV